MAARPKITVVGAGNVGATSRSTSSRRNWATSCWSTSSRACRRARRSTWSRPGRSRATTSRSPARTTTTRPPTPTSWSSPPALPRKPGMSRDDLLFKNAEIVGAVVEQVAQVLAERDPDPGHQSARRHGAAGVEEVGLPARARDRHGRRARLGALPHLHRAGARTSRSRTSPRSCWAATATRWCRCRATPRSPASRSPSCCRRSEIDALVDAHAQRRRRDREATSRPAAPTTRRRPRRWRWSRRSSRTRRRSCPARRTSKASTASTASSSACR